MELVVAVVKSLVAVVRYRSLCSLRDRSHYGGCKIEAALMMVVR